jgi:hypothetical protein
VDVPELLHSGEITEPKVSGYEISWEKKGKEISVGSYYGSRSATYCFSDKGMPWEGRGSSRIVEMWEDNLRTVKAEYREYEEAKRAKKEIEKRYDYAVKSLSQQVYDRKVLDAKMEFMNEHGDPELWADHLESLKIQKSRFSILDEALMMHSERGVDPVGRTVAEVLAQAREWEMGSRKGRGYYQPDYETIPSDLPLDWKIPPTVDQGGND